MAISFVVFGPAQPQGSARAFIPRGCSRPVITSDNKQLRSWRQDVAAAALAAMDGKQRIEKEPVKLSVLFTFEKPKSVRAKATNKATKPDLDKLIRALCDGMTGIVFRDDAQVSEISARKVFGTPPQTYVEVDWL